MRLVLVFVVACGSATPPATEAPQPLPSAAPTQPAPQSTPITTAQPIIGIGKATLVLVTEGANVELVSGADRRAVPQFPISINIKTTQDWTIVATKAGYRDYVQRIRFDGLAEKTFVIELAPK